jgi:hypothetical protein
LGKQVGSTAYEHFGSASYFIFTKMKKCPEGTLKMAIFNACAAKSVGAPVRAPCQGIFWSNLKRQFYKKAVEAPP